MSAPDRWSRWLLDRRDAGDAAQRAVTADYLADIRERVLGAVRPLDGATVLDVGTGDGLIGLAALGEVGPAGLVIFSDVSAALLEHCRAQVGERDQLDRARYANQPPDLGGKDGVLVTPHASACGRCRRTLVAGLSMYGCLRQP